MIQDFTRTSPDNPRVRLSETVPAYDETDDDREGTFLLFPCPSSAPLSSILTSELPVKRLVVLDCKWQRTSMRLNPNLRKLPRIHLDHPPKQSYFWRWHNSGEGMLSTVEAVYYAARQVATARAWEGSKLTQLVELFWLFSQQREIIRSSYEMGCGRKLVAPVPFTDDGKAYHRALRRREDRQKRGKIGSR